MSAWHGQGAQPACGLGLKPQHVHQVLQERPAVGFFEVHAENYMVDGGPLLRGLDRVREHYPVTLHGVGLSIGGAQPLDEAHLDRLAGLVARYQPMVFSEHLAWSSHGQTFFADLLPLPLNGDTLLQVCAHIDQVQDRLQRCMLLENPSSYLRLADSSWAEADFLSEVCRRTGCGLLLDLCNVQVSASNLDFDALAYLNALPLQRVGQMHLAGFATELAADGGLLCIDDHGSAVHQAVWQLHRWVCARLGAVPTLIERDHDIPELRVLVAEAALADAALGQTLEAMQPCLT
jgi:uncharacterized protein (UPF0276 family)